MLAAAVLVAGCTASEDPESAIEPIEAPTSDGEDPQGVDEADDAADADPAPAPDEDGAEGDDPAASPEIDVSVIPEEITLEYVDAVLIELERLYAEAIALSIEAGEPSITASDRLRSAFSSEQFELRLSELYELSEAGYPGFAGPQALGPRVHTNIELLDSGPTCIWARTTIDYSGLVADPVPPDGAILLLEPEDKSSLAVDLSMTPWVISSIPLGLTPQAQEDLSCE